MEEYFDVLNNRINEYLCLVVPEMERRETIKNLTFRLVDSLEKDIKGSKTKEEIKIFFSRFVGKMLSILESLVPDAKPQKGTRKLLLNEIYQCQDALIGVLNKNEEDK